MPEGPEARIMADTISPLLTNKVIISAYKSDRGKCNGLESLYFPCTILGVRTYGKKILIDIRNGVSTETVREPKLVHDVSYVIVISLGMNGSLQFNQGNHSHLHFDIGDTTIKGSFRIMTKTNTLYFDDSRYFGRLDIMADVYLPAFLASIGPDLLSASLNEPTWITKEQWISIFSQKKISKWSIGKALLDQTLVAGIGNYLRSEMLYYSAILPQRLINTLSTEELETLRVVSHKIILLSYLCGSQNRYQKVVYKKQVDPYGNPVISGKTTDGRTAYWVPAVQH